MDYSREISKIVDEYLVLLKLAAVTFDRQQLKACGKAVTDLHTSVMQRTKDWPKGERYVCHRTAREWLRSCLKTIKNNKLKIKEREREIYGKGI